MSFPSLFGRSDIDAPEPFLEHPPSRRIETSLGLASRLEFFDGSAEIEQVQLAPLALDALPQRPGRAFVKRRRLLHDNSISSRAFYCHQTAHRTNLQVLQQTAS